jgi:opacity protein-like surface antigen
MRAVRLVAGFFTLIILAAAPARADTFISPFLGFNFGGDSANCVSLRNCEDRRTNFGIALGVRNGIFGLEQEFGYAPDFFGRTEGGSNAVLTVMSNLLLVIPAGPIHPYGVIGIGLIRPHMKLDVESLTLDKNALAYDIGGGVNIYLVRSVGIRGDVRRLKTLSNVTLGFLSGEKLEFWRGSAGLTFRF